MEDCLKNIQTSAEQVRIKESLAMYTIQYLAHYLNLNNEHFLTQNVKENVMQTIQDQINKLIWVMLYTEQRVHSLGGESLKVSYESNSSSSISSYASIVYSLSQLTNQTDRAFVICRKDQR